MGGGDQPDRVVEDVVRHRHRFRQGGHAEQPGGVGGRGGGGDPLTRGPPGDLHQVLGRRERHEDLEEEAVELGLREGVGPLELDGVLGGQDEERGREAAGVVPHRHRPLLHRLEHGALGLRRGAVDLVGEHQVGEDRARLVAEASPGLGLLDDVRPHDVRRHQVGRELDPRERQGEDLPEGADEHGLPEPRDALQQDVAAGEQADERVSEQVGLAHHDRPQLPLDRLGAGGEGLRGDVLRRGVVAAHGPAPASPAKYCWTSSRSDGGRTVWLSAFSSARL